MPRSHQGWDRYEIVAELRRHRTSLEAVGRVVGLKRQSMWWSLVSPHRKANQAIADALGVPVWELWPQWFDEDGKLISMAPRPRPVAEPIPRVVSASRDRSVAV